MVLRTNVLKLLLTFQLLCGIALAQSAQATPHPRMIGVSITPISATVQVGKTQQFTAFLINSRKGVVWSTKDGFGTIDENGLFTAVAKGNGLVIAKSIEDPTKLAVVQVVVTVGPPPHID